MMLCLSLADRDTLVGNFTVGGGSASPGAAIRWFELSNTGTGWVLRQEGTHDPGDGLNRFMGSIAMDGDGNIALGYWRQARWNTRVSATPLARLSTHWASCRPSRS